MECLNSKCDANKEGQCINYLITSGKEICVGEIHHTPNYAEEQLEYAKEKERDEKVCYTITCRHNKNNECQVGKANCLIAKPLIINYEKEYYILKNENKELKNGRDTLNQRLDIAYRENKELREYNQQLENESNENDTINLKLHNQIEELKNIIKKLVSYL